MHSHNTGTRGVSTIVPNSFALCASSASARNRRLDSGVGVDVNVCELRRGPKGAAAISILTARSNARHFATAWRSLEAKCRNGTVWAKSPCRECVSPFAKNNLLTQSIPRRKPVTAPTKITTIPIRLPRERLPYTLHLVSIQTQFDCKLL